MIKKQAVLRTTLMLVLLLGLGVLSACAGDPGAGSGSGQAGEADVTPTVRLVAPAAGTTVPAGTVTVAVETTGLEFVMPSGGNVAGQGHVHFTLDDRPYEMSIEKTFEFEDVEPGTHTLEAELVQNDTSSFDPPVTQEIEFIVE